MIRCAYSLAISGVTVSHSEKLSSECLTRLPQSFPKPFATCCISAAAVSMLVTLQPPVNAAFCGLVIYVTISRYESGSKKCVSNDDIEIGVNALVKIAKYFNVSTDYLLGLTSEQTQDISALEIFNAIGLNKTSQAKTISKDAAKGIAAVLKMEFDKLFVLQEENSTLSAKTILEHHRLISTVLDQAEKEGLVPFNVAAKATLPKVTRKEVNYFQPEQVAAIRDALETEPVKWKMLMHLFLITGARRGEVLGLKWNAVDFAGNRVHICNNILYSPDVGIYEDTPKTATSDRWITLPGETMQLLRKYQVWQNTERLRFGEYYQNQGYLFAQDNGNPMHPDSVTDWMNKFSKRHELPHINPHAFRHTMASMLYFNGVDSVSISKRLGHAQVSTTANIYAHVMEAADQKNADILADMFLKNA